MYFSAYTMYFLSLCVFLLLPNSTHRMTEEITHSVKPMRSYQSEPVISEAVLSLPSVVISASR